MKAIGARSSQCDKNNGNGNSLKGTSSRRGKRSQKESGRDVAYEQKNKIHTLPEVKQLSEEGANESDGGN